MLCLACHRRGSLDPSGPYEKGLWRLHFIGEETDAQRTVYLTQMTEPGGLGLGSRTVCPRAHAPDYHPVLCQRA